MIASILALDAQDVQRGGNSSHLRKAWGEHLRPYAWDHLIHLTWRHSIGRERSMEAVMRFIRNLERRVQNPVRYYIAFEPTTTHHWHAHGVLAGTGDVRCSDLRARWFGQSDGGYSRINVYDARRGGVSYSMKRQTDDLPLLVSRRLPALVPSREASRTS